MEYNGIKVLVSEGAFKEYKNEELKDIMEYLEDPDIYVEDFGYCYKRLSLNDTNILLDYITNLQQRIDKAVEYIENNFMYHYGSHKEPIVFDDNYIQDLYDILRGKE